MFIMNKIYVVIGIIVVLIVATAGTYMLTSTVQENLAPNFTLVDLEGNTFTLSDFSGKVVVIDFMATWCGPCRQQIPQYSAIWENYKDQVVLISISIDPLSDSEQTLQSFKENFDAPWIWARDTENISVVYEISSIPTTVIIDKQGIIRFKHVGITSSATLTQDIEQLLG